jgi:4-hydroxythreonine-4-phosphate dehydrogenase
MGDVAGIGPEIIARAWPQLVRFATPCVIGDVEWMRRGVSLVGGSTNVQKTNGLTDTAPTAEIIPCLQGTERQLDNVRRCEVSGDAGQASYDFLCRAIELARGNPSTAIVTAPLHKEGLHAAGLPYPGHTEILAAKTDTRDFAMVLFGDGIAVAHVTLHMALRDVFQHLSQQAIVEKIRLLNALLPKLVDHAPRIAVAALNPHASDGGLFGDEEETTIRPAVAAAQAEGICVSGPWPTDTLFVRAAHGEFDGVVAMYHDQGHIALKLRSGWRAVNITVGLPIVRTSVAHGTAYDIAWKGIADASSLVAAAEVACRLIRPRTK